MKIAGTARSFDVSQPSLIRSFFGSNVYHFILITDNEVDIPTGRTTQVPVRLECFLRTPSFDGLRLEVDGEFDDFDSLVRAKMVAIKETGMTIGSVKRLGFLAAVISILLLYVLPKVANLLITGGLIFSAADDGEEWRIVLAVILTIVSNVVAALFVFVALLYLSRVAFPALYEAFDRILRRFTEYRSK